MMVRSPSGHWRGCMQRDGLFGDARRVAHQIERFDQFVARQLMLPAEAVRDRSASEFRRRRKLVATMPAPDCILIWWIARAERGGVPLLDAAELHGGFRERDALDAAHLAVGGEQQIQLALEGNLERILDEGILPGVDVGFVSGAMTTSWRLASAEARAMATACAAQAATPSRVSRSVEAKPQRRRAITRMPMPSDSDSASVPTSPFFVERSRRRMSITRASAKVAPRSFAVSSARWSHILHHRD